MRVSCWLKKVKNINQSDAIALISHITNTNRVNQLINDPILSQNQLQWLDKALIDYQNHTPISYLIGYEYFFGRKFLVNQHTLSPRPDSEILIETILDRFVSYETSKILDLGTGTGALAITLALEKPNCQVLAVDNNPKTLATAKENAKLLKADNVDFVCSDWFSQLIDFAPFDLIVSNPPYLAKNDPHLTKLVAEPLGALVADNNGLSDLEHILQNGQNFLTNNGFCVLEYGYQQKDAVIELAKKYNWQNIRAKRDYQNNWRMLIAEKN